MAEHAAKIIVRPSVRTTLRSAHSAGDLLLVLVPTNIRIDMDIEISN